MIINGLQNEELSLNWMLDKDESMRKERNSKYPFHCRINLSFEIFDTWYPKNTYFKIYLWENKKKTMMNNTGSIKQVICIGRYEEIIKCYWYHESN